MDRELDERIRERAYAIWEQEGRPEGNDFHHWLRAVEEVRAETGDIMAAEAGNVNAGQTMAETTPKQSDPAAPVVPDSLHAAPLAGASAAPAAQGSSVRATDKRRKLA
ncbi:DUF2934 domain-containing protein [Rhizobium sp. RU36D]|uniref:DUF2934 domain-containing protein n=1 Tax=Rhizobium sp. RU36D TaxID=1907415 RepID=UPI0009D8C219|nr:DUF2934 domain-containing protein [Rhizobium sp. RU36D]SMC98712.1 Protein of unknown function [Rhizobium sp. RU36D]